jgi:hypothetical protein
VEQEYNMPTFAFEDIKKHFFPILSLMILFFCVLAHFMAWQIAGFLVIVWTPLLGKQWNTFTRIDERIGLLFALLVIQSGHFAEHIAQMVEIHLLGWPALQSHGLFGDALFDTEWFHFFFDAGIVPFSVLILIATCTVPRYTTPRLALSVWLWILLPIVLWHAAEHIQIMSVYLSTGRAGTPGLLAHGGVIGGGLPLIRQDLHFIYNLVEEVLLILSFVTIQKGRQSL